MAHSLNYLQIFSTPVSFASVHISSFLRQLTAIFRELSIWLLPFLGHTSFSNCLMSKVIKTAMSLDSPEAAASLSCWRPFPLKTSASQTLLLFSFRSVRVSPTTLTLWAPGTLTLKRTHERGSSRPTRGSKSTQPFLQAE